MAAEDANNIFTFKDIKPQQDGFHEYAATLQGIPLIIDNGSYQCRVGWANEEKPKMIFKNLIARHRGKKESDQYIGNDIGNMNSEALRWQLKSQFDRNVVTQFDMQEQIFDYTFNHLGITIEGKIDHPIVMTEAACNPFYSRQQMSELLFECYHVPKVFYGVDAMFSLYQNHPQPGSADALIVSCGYQTTHILPVVGGALDAHHCRRINVGGAHMESYLLRLLQLKYPGHVAQLSLPRAEELIKDHCYFSNDYGADLTQWEDPDHYDDHVHKIQLPYNPLPGNTLSAEQQREKKEQQIKRLKEINAKKRLERLASEQEQLEKLMSVQELMMDDDDETFEKALDDLQLTSPEELQAEINKHSVAIQRLQEKISGIQATQTKVEPEQEAVYDLLHIPDDDLTDDQLQRKRRQQFLKAAKEGRERAKKQREEKRKQELEEERKMEEKRKTNFQGWLADIRGKRQTLLEKRAQRRQRRTDMAKRRTYASQQRMKIITALAEGAKKKKEDTFGMNDDDWNVYKEINKNAGESDSEVEQEQLDELETQLKEYDEEFEKDNDQENDAVFDIAEYYRLHLAVEQIRIPEILFQPSMMGMEQGGITDTIEFLLKTYTPDVQDKIMKYVFLTGGCATFKNLQQRMERDIEAIRPFKSIFNVHLASNPVLDPWFGAKKWTLSPEFDQSCITRTDYEEKGGEYIKEHPVTNRF